ncbi:hypothetical protein ADIARSV_0428 [Arcticibacter svalbardensis MN12-7]|uniref:Uncharacterized protein n=1 Tax=Arcticibacter svalbardensis MN12-7 TaxID=1150600 RepID=R9GX98_9SPHI|nr:hypothetical protein ADIARSV_0428 [Arcticibacter svalbardensis MN12-7]
MIILERGFSRLYLVQARSTLSFAAEKDLFNIQFRKPNY